MGSFRKCITRGGFTPVPRPMMAAHVTSEFAAQTPYTQVSILWRMDLGQRGCPRTHLRAMVADHLTSAHLISIYNVPGSPAFKEIPLWWQNIPAG